ALCCAALHLYQRLETNSYCALTQHAHCNLAAAQRTRACAMQICMIFTKRSISAIAAFAH
ncbi:MAG: hypothetical protein ACK56F_04965, partial [bacterium]